MPAPSWAEPYLTKINGRDNEFGFFWHDWDINNGRGGNYLQLKVGVASDYTWYRCPIFTRLDTTYGFVGRANYTEHCYSTTLTAINIVSNGSGYGLYFNDYEATNCIYDPYNGWYCSKIYNLDKLSGNIFSGTGFGNANYYHDPLEFSGTLEECLIYLCNNVRNIDIYVDGDLWSRVSPPTYQWQSVPSISGKNGILSLVTLDSESINDGEPVSGAAVSIFDQAPSDDNNIKNLADTYGGGEESSAVDVTVKYKVTLPPGGSFSTLKIVAKKDSIPENVSDGDKIVDISPSKTKKTVTGLDENSLYYFKIFGEDTNSNTSESDEKHITTSGDEGWLFDFTGSIQTFTAPKTGIYQLETWGAQGGDATDGTLVARGGYGAYAVGEVFLTQGETLYINVGGQNGYGGGGNYVLELDEYLRNLDYSNYVYISGGQNKVTPFSGYEPNIQQYYGTNKILVVGKSENLRPVWDSENNCIRTNGTAGRYDYVFVAIPLPHRLYGVTKYTALGKRENNGNTYGFIGVGCIVNDSMRQTKGGNSFETDWANIELDGDSGITSDAGFTYYHLEDMPYIDYLTFELSQGNLFWKDNKLYFE